ncbi:protein ABHD12B isoform X2 [Phalacrocorax carbo]|uniref:protein ABHD12B isoform X2 n=1 Tax=Phalacrocorax carbo TaxID=9209 RepID=UPI00311952EF
MAGLSSPASASPAPPSSLKGAGRRAWLGARGRGPLAASGGDVLCRGRGSGRGLVRGAGSGVAGRGGAWAEGRGLVRGQSARRCGGAARGSAATGTATGTATGPGRGAGAARPGSSVSFPFFVDLQRPELLLNNTINLYLTTEPGVTVGIWHTVPSSRGAEAQGKDQRWYEEALADAHPVIIYLHGNGGTRAASHRIQFLKTMGAADFHILALDYRGYGDSSGNPTERGFTTDVLALYDWAKARSGNSSILFWGHSMGTGVATNAARKLQEERGVQVDAVILESPYTDIREAAANIPITKIYRQFPGFEYFILDSLALSDMFFRSNENVKVLACPLLMLHAEDDAVVPLQLGHKLFETARSAYKDKTKVKLITFPEKLGLGHDYISFNPELPALVKDFLNIK